MPKTDQLIIRVAVSVATSDYGASIASSDTKLRIAEDAHLLIPTSEAGESARTMLQNLFNLPSVGAEYDTLMTAIAEKTDEKASAKEG